MERIGRQTSRVNEMIAYAGQTETIEGNRKRLFNAISGSGNANYSQLSERAQAILERASSTKNIALSFVSFPMLASELHHDLALYTRKVELLINKLRRFISAYSEFGVSLHETISTNTADLNHWQREFSVNRVQAQEHDLTEVERNERLLELNDQWVVFEAISDKLGTLNNKGMSFITNILQLANEDQRGLAAVLPPYYVLLRRLQSHINAPINVHETEEVVQNLDHAINALDAAIVAFNEAQETGDSFLIEQKVELLATKLSAPFAFPDFDEFVAFLETLMPGEPAGDFLRYTYILETPNELDVFLERDFVENEFTGPLNLNAVSPLARLDEIKRALEKLEGHERQIVRRLGRIQL